MWSQRQKYYKQFKAESKIYYENLKKKMDKESLHVPEEYKNFKMIPNLRKLCLSQTTGQLDSKSIIENEGITHK